MIAGAQAWGYFLSERFLEKTVCNFGDFGRTMAAFSAVLLVHGEEGHPAQR